MKAKDLTFKELLDYGCMGEVAGLHPEVAKRFAKEMEDAVDNVKIAENKLENEVAERVSDVLDKLEDEVRPKLLEEIRKEQGL